MTIPEISPLLLVSMCGLSFVCVTAFVVVGLMVFRFVAGDAIDSVTGLFGGDDDQAAPVRERKAIAGRRDLHARAQSFDFDPSSANTAADTTPRQFGENPSLRQDRRPTFNEKTRDWNLAPQGRLSDDPKNMHAPAPPDFNPNSEYLPNDRSNIGGRVGRHNTGRGQRGQRMDSSRHWSASSSAGGLRSDRNSRRDDEFFGGQADFDGDGDPDI